MLTALLILAAGLGCRRHTGRLRCTRDADCGAKSVCYIDDRCVPRNVARRMGATMGDECVVQHGTEYGCEDEIVCRMGRCDDGDGDADGGDGGASGESCTFGTLADGSPLFGGLTEVVVDGSDAVVLRWLAAADESAPETIEYLVFVSEISGAHDLSTPTITVPGALSLRIDALTTNTTYYFIVRARDESGQTECNTTELSGTPEAPPDCVDYATYIQPIFDANCLKCHVDPDPPQDLYLENYAGVMAGGMTGNEIVACQRSSSLLYQKISMSSPPVGERMPFGGPYLTDTQIELIGRWVDQGATPLCDGSPSICSDASAPTFAGVESAVLSATGLGADLCWTAGNDDNTATADILYDIFEATVPGMQNYGAPPAATSPPGATCINIEGLTPGQEYCWVARARDQAGNRDANTAELCVSIPMAGCIEYATMVQPIFDNDCVRCHSGANAPRDLHLDTYTGVLNGGQTGSEVIGCQSADSLLYQKTALASPPIGARMPFDGPPYLTAAQIATIQQWIDEGARATCSDPDICSDSNPPTFAGINTATLSSSNLGADLCWSAATDDVSAQGDLLYDIFQSNVPGGENFGNPPATTSAAGATCINLEGLTPGQQYCWVIRARDLAGNRDANTAEQCVLIPAASCIDYATMVQPIFDNSCTRCHVGALAPQDLLLDSYAGVITGGLTGSEVIGCQSSSSLLYQKIAMDSPPLGVRMPFDGPPYLPQAQIDTIQRWIDEGARASCNDPDPCSDITPPTFTGLLIAALSASGAGADLCWSAGSDNLTAAGDLVYDVYQSLSPGNEDFGSPPVTVSPAGATCVNLEGLTPGQEYCWVVRARDQAGNRDANTIEDCVVVPTASCIEYATVIQPIFDSNCTRCHAGGLAPQNLQLDTLGGVIAGGLTGNEVIACQSASSLLYQKVALASPPIGVRMPLDGPPYLSQAQIDAISQWIDEGARQTCADPSPCNDVAPPVFAGVTSAVLTGTGVGADLCWSAATDDTTASADIIYDVFEGLVPGGQDFSGPATATSAAGTTCINLEGLTPGQEYCWVVRARDQAGNRDGNTSEECVTIPAAACVDFVSMLQPIFNNNCTRCHAGPLAPQDLLLDSYAGVMAGGLTGNEVIACQPTSSLLYQKITMSNPPVGARMPLDGPPYLAPAQIDTVTQWIAEGARSSCAVADPCSDATPPTFAGIESATAQNATTAQLCWQPGADNLTSPTDLLYDIYEAGISQAQDFSSATYSSAAGATCRTVNGLSPNTQYCWVVRARDGAGNRDGNVAEQCLTMPLLPAGCVEYATMIQPLFNRNCTRCHTGPSAPQHLDLSSYEKTLAGSVRRSEISSCNSGASLLIDKVEVNPSIGDRMPRDGPPYLTSEQIAMLTQWVDTGGRRSCGEPDPCGDGTRPTLAGAASATALDETTIRVCWPTASDNVTPASSIRYEIFESTISGNQRFNEPAQWTLVGGTCFDVTVGPNTNMCFVVRGRDLAGNTDQNNTEVCAATSASACAVEYNADVRPILAARCTYCHSGANPPRYLDLGSYGAIFAGGALRREVLACNWSGSLLRQKLNGNTCGQRMPFDGPPWIAPSELSVLQTWVQSGARQNCGEQSPCADSTAPTFSGATSATALDPTTIEVCWDPASDDISASSGITYDIYEANNPSGERFNRPPSYSSPAGTTCIEIQSAPGRQFCYVVRARDLAGNRDGNNVERCAATPGGCVDYWPEVQPIFNARCVQCHSGPNPPKDVNWENYANQDRGVVDPCDAGSSDLIDMIEACDMPRDTMNDMCSTTACLTPSQQRILREWVNQGAWEDCPNGGCP